MNSLKNSFANMMDDISETQFWGYIVKSAIIAIVILMALMAMFSVLSYMFFQGNSVQEYSSHITSVTGYSAVADAVIYGLGGIFVFGMVFSLFIQFPIVMVLIVSMYSDDMARWIENKKGYRIGQDVPMATAIKSGLAIFLRFVIINILLLPVYILFFPLAPLVYVMVNGYIIGRSYFEVIGLRHYSHSEFKTYRKKHRGAVFVVGGIHMVMAIIPFVNIIMPAIMVSVVSHYVAKPALEDSTEMDSAEMDSVQQHRGL